MVQCPVCFIRSALSRLQTETGELRTKFSCNWCYLIRINFPHPIQWGVLIKNQCVYYVDWCPEWPRFCGNIDRVTDKHIYLQLLGVTTVVYVQRCRTWRDTKGHNSSCVICTAVCWPQEWTDSPSCNCCYLIRLSMYQLPDVHWLGVSQVTVVQSIKSPSMQASVIAQVCKKLGFAARIENPHFQEVILSESTSLKK